MSPASVPPGAALRHRRLRLRVAALAGAAALVLSACGPSTMTSVSGAPAAEVEIASFRFTPDQLTVKAGTAIRWTNGGHLEDIAHSVDFPGAGIDSGTLHHGDRFTHTFTAPGTYTYICSIHPFMHGTVVVTP